MSAALDIAASPSTTGAADAFGEIEFEIALDLEDPVLLGFEPALRSAAEAVGGEFLFALPADGTIEDASRIGAVRLAAHPREAVLLAILNEAGTRLRIAGRDEIGARFHCFARAFVAVMERLRRR